MIFEISRLVVDIGQLESEREAGFLRESCKNISDGRETVLDFGLKDSVGKKGFDDFYNFNLSVEGDLFIEGTFVSQTRSKAVSKSKNTEVVCMSFLKFSLCL